MAFVGEKVDMNWGIVESGASDVNKFIGVFSHFNISTSPFQDYNAAKVRSNLYSRKPVYVSAFANRERKRFLGLIGYDWRYLDGHAWIINGLDERRTKYVYTYRWEYVDGLMPLQKSMGYDDIYPGKIEVEEFTSTTTSYYIFNWGWNGEGDGGRYISGQAWMEDGKNYQYLRQIIPDLGI